MSQNPIGMDIDPWRFFCILWFLSMLPSVK